MRYLLSIILSVITFHMSIAQIGQQYSQYLINPFTINPAISSTEDYIDVQMGYRSQWTGFQGGTSPRTAYATTYRTIGKPFYHMHYKAEHKNWHGVGAHVYDDKSGPIHRNAFLVAYSYNIGITKKTRLSVGSFMGIKQLRTNVDYWVDIEDNTDLLFSHNLNSGIQPELQLGAVLYAEDYFITLAAHDVIPQNTSLTYDGNNTENQNQVFMSAGFKTRLNKNTKITPSVFVKYASNSPLAVDLNVKVDHNSDYWYGVSTRYKESVNVFAGLNINMAYDITYAFEWSYSKLSAFNSGTHEIILGLRLQHPNIMVDPSKFW